LGLCLRRSVVYYHWLKAMLAHKSQRQRPITLPRSLADFIATSARQCKRTPSEWLGLMIDEKLADFTQRLGGDELQNLQFDDDSPVKILINLAPATDDSLEEFSEKIGQSSNLVIFQLIYKLFSASVQGAISPSRR
jgi:hypothetical protein